MKLCVWPSLILSAILLATACAPAAPTKPAVSPPVAVGPSVAERVEPQTPVDLTATQIFTDSLLSATPPVDVQPVATSRGPNLEASNPATVSLASGQVQFVEFFRFT